MDEWIPWVQVPDPKSFVLKRDGIILGWGPTEESLDGLKRQLGGDVSKTRRAGKSAYQRKKKPSDPELDFLSSVNVLGDFDQLLDL